MSFDYAGWSNFAKVVYKRTYARRDSGRLEDWPDTVERVIQGNVKGFDVSPEEINRLRYFLMNRKSSPAGRGLWFSGAPAHARVGGAALTNCWAFVCDDWHNLVDAMDLLMLGGGVGMSVESVYVHQLPRVRKGVSITHVPGRDADFIVPDSREGWVELCRRVFEAYFVTGRSFTWSTCCLRAKDEPIAGFGGKASGPQPLIEMVSKLCAVLQLREGRHIRPIDAGDLLCCIGECVRSGNVRRSAILLLGDPWDREYLKAKRWDLGTLPSQRGSANWSVNCSDVDDLHPLFWQTYEHGEPFGIVNMKVIRKYGRMGELKPDTARAVNPCAEATLEDHEGCDLVEHFLKNMRSKEEFIEGARLMHRYAKRVAAGPFHIEKTAKVFARNMRVGSSISGVLSSPLSAPEVLDEVYAAIQDEDRIYSKLMGWPESIRLTVGKPSGTLSKVFDMAGEEGVHAPLSRYIVQNIRIATSDGLIAPLRAAGHPMEPEQRLDGSIDLSTQVVDFYIEAAPGAPVVDEGWDTWKQLEAARRVQKHWADQSVSVTVYYEREEIPLIKAWLADNISTTKTVSFLLRRDHGFKQAPKRAITQDEFWALSDKLKPLDLSSLDGGGDLLDGLECEGGACPVR